MAEGFKIQVNVKIGEELVNLRADSSAEAEAIFAWAIEKADLIREAITAVKGTQVVAGALGGQVVEQQAQSWGQHGSQQQAPAQEAAPQGGKRCTHGEMVYRTGTSAKGPWQAYFCPTPKGTPGQCKAEFVR